MFRICSHGALRSILAMLAASVMLFTFIAPAAFAAETVRIEDTDCTVYTEGDYKYAIYGENAYIVKYNGTAAAISTPQKLAGKTVTHIMKDAFKGNTAVQTLTVNAGVVSIGQSAFENCTGLQTVLIAKDVVTISSYAFKGATALKSVTFQTGTALKTIGYEAFRSCASLATFNIPETVETIGTGAFSFCKALTAIVIPDSVTAFASIKALMYLLMT